MKSFFRPNSRPSRHEPQHGSGDDSKQAKFWRSKPGKPSAEQHSANARARNLHARESGKTGKTAQEIRILYLKKRHQIAKLMRKYPEIDWYAEERAKERMADIARLRRGQLP